ncbi:MAG: hypothetical protein ACE5IR_07050 [bacterium]
MSRSHEAPKLHYHAKRGNEIEDIKTPIDSVLDDIIEIAEGMSPEE